jgi:hypothetical protein
MCLRFRGLLFLMNFSFILSLFLLSSWGCSACLFLLWLCWHYEFFYSNPLELHYWCYHSID